MMSDMIRSNIVSYVIVCVFRAQTAGRFKAVLPEKRAYCFIQIFVIFHYENPDHSLSPFFFISVISYITPGSSDCHDATAARKVLKFLVPYRFAIRRPARPGRARTVTVHRTVTPVQVRSDTKTCIFQ